MSAPNALASLEVWFLTGSQHLYGPETLAQVAWQSQQIAGALEAASAVPVRIVWKPVLTQPDEIRRVMLAANDSDAVVGVIAWMHTFSPAKMWIAGLSALDKPLLHLHTQANVALPWADIDFDFMNLNQAAHGDREFGYIQTRLALRRKTVVGHVSDPRVVGKVATWARAAAGWAATRTLKLARFGDNMRFVAVTEGDKTEAEAVFGVQVNTWGVNDLAKAVADVDPADVDDLLSSLVDKSLLQPVREAQGEAAREAGGARLRMLETVREYGSEQLAGRGELGDRPERHDLQVNALLVHVLDPAVAEVGGQLEGLGQGHHRRPVVIARRRGGVWGVHQAEVGCLAQNSRPGRFVRRRVDGVVKATYSLVITTAARPASPSDTRLR